MSDIEDQSIDLVLTSPPYPMIQMWDDQFSLADPEIATALSKNDGTTAFECMHRQLDAAWEESLRVLKTGGIACINIGDATRTLNGHFQLFPNHARIITKFLELGFSQLPTILWRKPTNAPNKFMGSGMLPPGAYVTLEHEYILTFRKGPKRTFSEEQKNLRRQSAYFWEERNAWFSDVWFDLRGTSQKLNGWDRRKRSGAFPLELPFRLMNMYSIQTDTILDPFMGSGTTMIAAMCAARNSVGYEIDATLQSTILEKVALVPDMANQIVQTRFDAHHTFVDHRMKTKGNLKHMNRPYGFPVITRQEEDLRLRTVSNIQYLSNQKFLIKHAELVPVTITGEGIADEVAASRHFTRPSKGRQLKIF
jgi:DNA modification methylase